MIYLILGFVIGFVIGCLYGCQLTYRNNNLYTGKLSRFNREEILEKKKW